MLSVPLLRQHIAGFVRYVHSRTLSWDKNPDAAAPSLLQVLMRARRLRHRIAAADLHLDHAGFDGAKQRVGPPQQLASFLRVRHKGRAGDVKRAEPIELEYVEGSNRPRGGAERDQQTPRLQAAQRFLECILSHRIKTTATPLPCVSRS